MMLVLFDDEVCFMEAVKQMKYWVYTANCPGNLMENVDDALACGGHLVGGVSGVMCGAIDDDQPVSFMQALMVPVDYEGMY